ncbi:MAG: hypothetical protein IPK31_16450 [Chitinophagaceae bacterium]|nr:hypothetical protein [Chitinophagaceae bacterium]
MEHIELILPIAILILSFLLRLAIDRSVEAPILLKAIYELPVDIVFLALSFLAAHAISLTTSKNDALFYCFVITIISILNVIIWRRSIKLYDGGSIGWSIFLTAINYFTTIFILYKVIENFLLLKQ